jgi:hypothetical protein
MSIALFIPQVWSSAMLRYLDKALVFAAPSTINRDYEGDISAYGDTVKINQVGPITVRDYTKDTDMVAPDALTAAQQVLVIDQAKYVNFAIDSIDQAQTNPKVMGTAMERAAYAVADTIDQFVNTTMTAAIPTANALGTVSDLGTATNAYVHLVALGTVLSQSNVPRDGRWCIVPPWYHDLLLQDQRFVSATTSTVKTSGQDDVLQNGVVGRAAGFDIMISNNVTATNGVAQNSVATVVAGHPWATTFAQQLVNLTAYEPQYRFADAVKGLHVYGAKVVLPNALASLGATHP